MLMDAGQEALDAMASRVEQARDKWEVESYVVQQRNKVRRLLSTGSSCIPYFIGSL